MCIIFLDYYLTIFKLKNTSIIIFSRCHIPECENSTNEFLVPWWPDGVPNKCLKPVLKDSFVESDVCTKDSFTGQYDACTKWVYESNDTVVGEVCIGEAIRMLI